jgi:hypothetical protein
MEQVLEIIGKTNIFANPGSQNEIIRMDRSGQLVTLENERQ